MPRSRSPRPARAPISRGFGCQDHVGKGRFDRVFDRFPLETIEDAREVFIAMLVGDFEVGVAGQVLRFERSLFEGRLAATEGDHLRSRGGEGERATEMRTAAIHADAGERVVVIIRPLAYSARCGGSCR